MPLPPEDAQKVIAFLDAKLTACPVCRADKFVLADRVTLQVEATRPEGEVLLVGGPQIPAVIVACAACGYLMPFSWVVISRWEAPSE